MRYHKKSWNNTQLILSKTGEKLSLGPHLVGRWYEKHPWTSICPPRTSILDLPGSKIPPKSMNFGLILHQILYSFQLNDFSKWCLKLNVACIIWSRILNIHLKIRITIHNPFPFPTPGLAGSRERLQLIRFQSDSKPNPLWFQSGPLVTTQFPTTPAHWDAAVTRSVYNNNNIFYIFITVWNAGRQERYGSAAWAVGVELSSNNSPGLWPKGVLENELRVVR